MDIDTVTTFLAASPVPLLATAFTVVRFIYATFKAVQEVQQTKAENGEFYVNDFDNLVICVAQLLYTLNEGFRDGRLFEGKTAAPLRSLQALLEEVSTFAQAQLSNTLVDSPYVRDQRAIKIEGYHRQIQTLIICFQVSASVDIREWQSKNDATQSSNQRTLLDRFDDLERNQSRIMHALSLQGPPQEQSDEKDQTQEVQLSRTGGREAKLDSWTILPSQVELGDQIYSGTSASVHQAQWNKTQVATKAFKTRGKDSKTVHSVSYQIRIWSKLTHPHILQFLGGNVLDHKPFIVMPYFSNGSALNYIESHPSCDRAKILHHISLGLFYLHSKDIVHGNLTASNVLIDDSGRAVINDFDNTCLEGDVLPPDRRAALRHRAWSSPEILKGASPKRTSDVYSLGMTMVEIYTNEEPLRIVKYVSDAEFVVLVSEQNLRPERPDEENAPNLTDAIWQLAEQCWMQDPKDRPEAGVICDTIEGVADSSSALSPLSTGKLVALPTPTPTSSSVTLSPAPSAASSSMTLRVPSVPVGKWAGSIMSMLGSNQSKMPKLLQYTSSITSVAFSPDGSRILSCSRDRTIVCWDSKTGLMVLGPLKAHTDWVRSVAYSPDGKRFVSASDDKTVIIWEAKSGDIIVGPLEGHVGCVKCVAFSADGSRIVSGANDKTIIVWDSTTGHMLLKSSLLPKAVNSVMFSPDDTLIICGTDPVKSCQTIHVLHAKSLKIAFQPQTQRSGSILSVAFSPDGSQFVTAVGDGSIWVWSTSTQLVVAGPFNTSDNGFSARAVAFSPDGRWIVSGSGRGDQVIRVWELESQTLIYGPFKGHEDLVSSVCFSPDGKYVISGSWDKTIRAWELA